MALTRLICTEVNLKSARGMMFGTFTLDYGEGAKVVGELEGWDGKYTMRFAILIDKQGYIIREVKRSEIEFPADITVE